MSDEVHKDKQRSVRACLEIFDSRLPDADRSEVLVTLEQVVAMMLLAVMGGDSERSARMLNEGLVVGVERRLLNHAERQREKAK